MYGDDSSLHGAKVTASCHFWACIPLKALMQTAIHIRKSFQKDTPLPLPLLEDAATDIPALLASRV